MKKSPSNAILGGVCSGIGDHFGIDPLFIRLAFVFAFLGFGAGILLYLILWFLMD